MDQCSIGLLKTLWEKEKLLTEKFLLFAMCFLPSWRTFCHFHPMKNCCLQPHLTHYQTTNFRFFQTKRVCRWQFQIWWKWKKVIQTGRKHCGKRRNRSNKQFLLFPQCFQKACFPGVPKGVIVWEWVNLEVSEVCQLGNRWERTGYLKTNVNTCQSISADDRKNSIRRLICL